MDENDKKFQKDLAIGQIGATAGATLGSFVTAIGIALIVFSTSLSFDGITDDGSKSQFFQIMSGNYLVQGIIILIMGVGTVIGSMVAIIAKIQKLE